MEVTSPSEIERFSLRFGVINILFNERATVVCTPLYERAASWPEINVVNPGVATSRKLSSGGIEL